jgi:hypothetical protein
MGREVRMVPPDWQHPKNKDGYYVPLHEHMPYNADEITEGIRDGWLDSDPPHYGCGVMPQWAENERTHFQMYETCSEGTPISPVMETKEELARWLADSGASAFADLTATYEQWLATIEQGSSVSAAIVGGRLVSGVELNTEATHGQ